MLSRFSRLSGAMTLGPGVAVYLWSLLVVLLREDVPMVVVDEAAVVVVVAAVAAGTGASWEGLLSW